MASVTISFIPSDNNYLLRVPIDDTILVFRTRWNTVEGAWYFDLYDDADLPILLDIKVVLGVNFGRHSRADIFTKYILRAKDTTGQGLEAGYDDLGARVVVTMTPVAGIFDDSINAAAV